MIHCSARSAVTARIRLSIGGLLAVVVVAAAGCGGGGGTAVQSTLSSPTETTGTSSSTSPPSGTTAPPATTTAASDGGNAQDGLAVFNQAGCGGCHALSQAGSNGSIGPNLDTALRGRSASFIRTSIVDPNAFVAPGYPAGVMPQSFDRTLTPKQIDDLVALLRRQ